MPHDLSWREHIKSLTSDVSKMTDVVRALRYDLDRSSIETTYFSFVRPKLEYACQVWCNCTKKDADLLEAIQLNFARFATGVRKGTSHSLLYKITNWKPQRFDKVKIIW